VSKLKRITLRIFILFFIGIYLSFPIKSAAQYRTIKKKINEILRDENLSDAFTGIEIFDVSRNREVYKYNSKKLFTPASNQKILTTAAALYFLPDDFKFTTPVRIDGPLVDSVLYGDLIIKGKGDPLFSSKDLDSLSRGIFLRGIREIRGNVLGDVGWCDSSYFGAGWMWDDNPNGYMPYLSALILNKSRVLLDVTPTHSAQLAKVRLIDSELKFPLTNLLITVSGDSSNYEVVRDFMNAENSFFANGFISVTETPDTISLNVYNPNGYFLSALKNKFDSLGTKVTGKFTTTSNAPYIAELFSLSHPLDSVITETNKESVNINAEMLLRSLAAEYYGEPATASNGAKLVDSLILLSGNDPKRFVVADGSGLSRYNLTSPKLITDVLVFLMRNAKDKYNRLISSFPVAGVDGTLEKRMQRGFSFNNVRAKTGTMSSVSALSGVVTNRRGRKFLFSIMMQNYSCKIAEIRDIQDKICETVAGSRR
jgi:D-alanyl-D-alanine carboxypeptidase/D-alanyl-D-alanine-endopeptidase (penicillin-binding protein 4)